MRGVRREPEYESPTNALGLGAGGKAPAAPGERSHPEPWPVGPGSCAAGRAPPMRKGLFLPAPGPLRGAGVAAPAGRGEWNCPGPARPRCPPRSRAGSASGGRNELVQAPPSGLWFGKKRLSLGQEKSERSPLPPAAPGRRRHF